MTTRFRVSGVLEEEGSGRPLRDLIVRAYDKDLLFDDLLGSATSDEAGGFEIQYTERAFKDVFEKRPDLYLRVFDPTGWHLIHDTADEVRRNAGLAESFHITIPAANLGPDFERHHQALPAGLQFERAIRKLTPHAPLTPLLLAINVAVFAVMVATGISPYEPTQEDLFRWGANFGPATLEGAWWRALTCTFVHAGALHLAVNMYVLWAAGRVLERLVGSSSFLALYVLSGLMGSIASLAWHPLSVSVGASGAIFGVYGGLIGFVLLRRGSIYLRSFRTLLAGTVLFVAFNVLLSLGEEQIDMAAHLGGLGGGLVYGLILSQPVSYRSLARRRRRLVAVVAVGWAAVLVGASAIPKTVVEASRELDRFVRAESKIIDTFNDALTRVESGELSDIQFMALLEREVVPQWSRAQKRLEGLEGLPEPLASHLAELKEYAHERERAWNQMVEALRDEDVARLERAFEVQAEVDAKISQIFGEGAPP